MDLQSVIFHHQSAIIMSQRISALLTYFVGFSLVGILIFATHQQSFGSLGDFKKVYRDIGGRVKSRVKMKVLDKTSVEEYSSSEEKNYSFPILEGWPPDKSVNLVDYLLPEEDTTLIFPKKLDNFRNEKESKVLVVCQSSWSKESLGLRKSIRSTWANSSVQTIFILGTASSQEAQSGLEQESQMFGDILQENFVDTYNNLTLKTMFMLKFLSKLMDIENSFEYIFKVDDDCYVNTKPLDRFLKSHSSFTKVIYGHTLGDKNAVHRPDRHSLDRFIMNKWEVPDYFYPGKNTFPNSVSGSGYLMRTEDVECLYKKGLETPYLHLEDVFMTGLVARQCHLKLIDLPRMKYMGVKDICKGTDQKDVLIHHIKTPHRMKLLHQILSGKLICSSEENVKMMEENNAL